MWLCLFTKL